MLLPFELLGAFVRSKVSEKMILHLDITSASLHKDSEEAKIQMQKEDGTFDGIPPLAITLIL